MNRTFKLLAQTLCATALFFSQLQASDCWSLINLWEVRSAYCGRFWADAEYLYWKIQDSPEPVPLVIANSNANFDPIAEQPTLFIGQSGTSIVLGDKKVENRWRSGGRFTLGYWFDNCHCYGVEGNYFFLQKGSKSGSVKSNGKPGSLFLSVPFFDVTTGLESSSPIASSISDSTATYSGYAKYTIRNKMQGAELNGIMALPCCFQFNWNLLGGFRYWNFDEDFTFYVSSPYLLTGTANPPEYISKDKFDVENNFYGGQIGVNLDYTCNCFDFNLKGKVALGANCGRTSVHGFLITNDFNNSGSLQEFDDQGFFALPTNVGSCEKTTFSVIPEVDINLGYHVTKHSRIYVGYTFLYVSNMLWASKQIDRNINPTQSVQAEFSPDVALVGAPDPVHYHKTSSLWTQGINVGLEFTF